jgi:hypothetical protein
MGGADQLVASHIAMNAVAIGQRPQPAIRSADRRAVCARVKWRSFAVHATAEPS